MVPEFVDDNTTSKRIERQKARMLTELEITPIPSIVVKRVNISHSTYYRWIKEDEAFAKKAAEAMEVGIGKFNDVAISKLLQKVNEGDMRAMIYWLSHNHPKYKNQAQLTPEQVRELLATREIAEYVLNGSIPLKDARFLLSFFRHERLDRRSQIYDKALGDDSNGI